MYGHNLRVLTLLLHPSSLEEYFGLIASSVPMLRPLVGKAMGLSSTDYYYGRNTGDTRDWAQRARNRSHYTNTNTHRSDVIASRTETGYELDERETSSEGGTGNAGVHGGTVYQHEAESEEKILGSPQTDFRATVETSESRAQQQSNVKGITMTTEITVS